MQPQGPLTFQDWLKSQIDSEDYWFHKIELPGGLVTPGWSYPKLEKLPYFGLPDDLTGMRVLDIGRAEGFFSFEAERRGASEVVSIDNYPPMARQFQICRAALGSKARSHLASVYELSPKTFGTFDLVLFYGVLYHLRHPLLALEKIFSVATVTILMQTVLCQDSGDRPIAEFHPFGIQSGPADKPSFDPTCFWFPNAPCCLAMLAHVGFQKCKRLPGSDSVGGVFSAEPAQRTKGTAPDEMKAPWS